MRTFARVCLGATIVAALAACGTSTPPALDAAGINRLETLRDAPGGAGERIYRGAVFPLQPENGAQVFSYERRFAGVDGGFAAAHVTRDTRGEVVVLEAARFSPAYEVTRFDAIHREAGYSGSVVITNGRHLAYRLEQGGRVKTATEEVSDPVVTGPSLHGFILRHWDTLAQGAPVRVRMVVLAKMQTYGFVIEHAGQAGGRTAFLITPTNFLVGLALDPLRVEFDAASRNVVRYVGRVPPLQRVDGRLQALDARVEYSEHVPTYR